MKNKSTGIWMLQLLETNHNGYPWETFTIRTTKENYCLATVGDIDRATAPQNKQNAQKMVAAPELLSALENLFEACNNSPVCHGESILGYPFLMAQAKNAIDRAKGLRD